MAEFPEFIGPMTTGGTGAYTGGPLVRGTSLEGTSGFINLFGFKEIYDALLNLPKQIRKTIMNKVMRAGNKIFLDAIRMKAPRGSGYYKEQKKGHVADAAYISRPKWTYDGVMMGIGMRRDQGFNWHFLEFGTGRFYAGKGGKSKREAYRIPKLGKRKLIAFPSTHGSVAGPSYKRFLTMGEEGFASYASRQKASQFVIVYHAKHPGIVPRPFVRPAFDENKERVIDEVGRVAGREIEKYYSDQVKKITHKAA